PEELFHHADGFILDATALRKGRTALLRYSLLRRNTLDQTYSMHRLVQDLVIDDLPPDLQRQWRERVVDAVNAAFPEQGLGVSDKYLKHSERLLPHVLVCKAWKDDELT